MIGKTIKFVYNDIHGEIFLKKYLKRNKILITYQNIDFEIKTDALLHCNLRNITSNIFIKDPKLELIKYIQDDYNTIKNLTINSDKYVTIKCPYCNTKRKIQVKQLFRFGRLSCKKCSDGKSYPEKFVYCLLEQLGVYFECELQIKENNKIVRYDFYLPLYNLVIETDGIQHFQDNNKWHLNNDEYKINLLSNKGIKVIHIDCRYSNIDYIKASILNSEIKVYFDLSKIDWVSCHRNACNSKIFEAANKYNSGITDLDILSKMMKVNRATLREYLKKANNLGICDFSIEQLKTEQKEKSLKTRLKNVKKIGVYQNGTLIKNFESVRELCEKSKELFGVHFNRARVGEVANHKYGRKSYHGYTFEWQ